MAHDFSKEAEMVLDKEIQVLNKGFVRLVDYMGNDSRIVQAARVSYGEGTKSYRQDRGLIRYLLRNEHTSPFEQVILTFHCKMPLFVARQWIRHRTARVNEISGRYSVMENEFYLPAEEDVQLQSTDNKQGRSQQKISKELVDWTRQLLEDDQKQAYHSYTQILDKGIARELSRINLPLSLYTQWYWQIDLHNLFHFLKLRLDPHAQKEIRVYAQAMLDLCQKVCPMATEAFQDYILGGVLISASEKEALLKMLGGEKCPLEGRDKEILAEKLGCSLD